MLHSNAYSHIHHPTLTVHALSIRYF